MLLFRFTATMRGMRLIATVLALFVVATAAAAQEWRGEPSPEQQSIVLRPSELPAETPALLLDLKLPPASSPSEAKPAAPPVLAAAGKANSKPKPTAQPPVTVVEASPRTPALGAAPAPAPAPVAIRTASPAAEGNDDDDSDHDSN